MVLSLLWRCCVVVRFSIIYIHLYVSVCCKCQYNFTFDTFMDFVFITTNPWTTRKNKTYFLTFNCSIFIFDGLNAIYIEKVFQGIIPQTLGYVTYKNLLGWKVQKFFSSVEKIIYKFLLLIGIQSTFSSWDPKCNKLKR